MPFKKYRVGIIGCGRVAGLLEDDKLRRGPSTHVGGYLNVPSCKVVACCSKQLRHAESFSRRFNIPRCYGDYKEMLKKECLDIVSVCTYADTHAEITIAAAKSGVRAVFCEKAMATSLSEAKKMISTCKRRGVILAVNHTRRWDRHYIYVKRLLDSGKIGRVLSATGIFSGNLIHTGIHMFDIMRYLFGDVKYVSGILKKHKKNMNSSSGYKYGSLSGIDDRDGYATLIFKSGIMGYILGDGRKYFIFELDILGDKGRIRVGNNMFELWLEEESKNYSGFRELGLVSADVGIKAPSAFVSAISEIVGAIEGRGSVTCSGDDAYKAMELAVAVYESAYREGEFIKPSQAGKDIRILSR